MVLRYSFRIQASLLFLVPRLGGTAAYLAKPFPYHQASKNCRYDPHILQGHLWGGIYFKKIIRNKAIMNTLAQMKMPRTQGNSLRALARSGNDASGISRREALHLWQIFC
jgi:hypothetical protein